MDPTEVALSASGSAAVVTLPSGPFSRRAARQLDQILAGIHEDDSDDVRVVVVEGSGSDFCATVTEDLAAAGVDPPGRVARLRQPVVAAIEGACHSAGLVLALAADIRVVAPAATLSLPEVAESRLPPWHGIERLTRVAGSGRAAPLVLLGEAVDGEDAVKLGLAHECHPDPRARARELAALLAERAPLALEYTKEAVWRGASEPIEEALRMEGDLNHLLQASEDRAEGLRAFFEKREPRFRGR